MRCSISSNSMFFYQFFLNFEQNWKYLLYIVVVFQVVHLYQKLLTGMRKAPPRWQFCAEITHKFFGHLLNSLLHRWSTLHLNCFELVDTDGHLIREQLRELGARESEVQRIFAGLRQAVSSQVLAQAQAVSSQVIAHIYRAASCFTLFLYLRNYKMEWFLTFSLSSYLSEGMICTFALGRLQQRLWLPQQTGCSRQTQQHENSGFKSKLDPIGLTVRFDGLWKMYWGNIGRYCLVLGTGTGTTPKKWWRHLWTAPKYRAILVNTGWHRVSWPFSCGSFGNIWIMHIINNGQLWNIVLLSSWKIVVEPS